VLDPLPAARWPERLEVAASPVEAYARTVLAPPDERTSLASRAVEHHAGAQIELVAWRDGRIVVDVAGEGGLLILARAYQPLWRARLASGERLATQPADLALLGVEVPAGRQRVVLDVAAWPEALAGGIALAVTLAALAALVVGARRP